MTQRKFEVVTRYQDQNINLPQRQTKDAAGYDLEAATDFVVPAGLQPVLVPTGLKVQLPNDEVLLLVSRSSGPLKRGLVLPNAVGVIDADYYNNTKNEGEIFVQMMNFLAEDCLIKKGERICQGIFTKFLVTSDDQKNTRERLGGFGSSGQ